MLQDTLQVSAANQTVREQTPDICICMLNTTLHQLALVSSSISADRARQRMGDEAGLPPSPPSGGVPAYWNRKWACFIRYASKARIAGQLPGLTQTDAVLWLYGCYYGVLPCVVRRSPRRRCASHSPTNQTLDQLRILEARRRWFVGDTDTDSFGCNRRSTVPQPPCWIMLQRHGAGSGKSAIFVHIQLAAFLLLELPSAKVNRTPLGGPETSQCPPSLIPAECALVQCHGRCPPVCQGC